jgi:hypothetical protein
MPKITLLFERASGLLRTKDPELPMVLLKLAAISNKLFSATLSLPGSCRSRLRRLVYPVAAVAAGLTLLYFGVLFEREHSLARARYVLLASVSYLPLLLAVMVIDRPV